MFGSWVRGEQREGSDLDLLVDFDGPIDLFAYAGLLPNTRWLQGVVALDADGRIAVDEQLGSDQAGLFAAGFARSGHSGQAAEAEADGKAVAEAVLKYLNT